MSSSPEDLSPLHGDALDEALSRRWTTTTDPVTIGDQQWQIFKPANADHLISEADYVLDERLPYWADLWPSARVLAATLLREHGNGRQLLEMGCGVGLATIAAMKAGFDVTATDYYEEALHVTRGNAARNLGVEPRVRMVNWRSWPDNLGLFDVVIAADVLYEAEYAGLVASCLTRALSSDGVAIIADPGRLALPAFRERVVENGLRIVDVETTRYEEGIVRQEVQVMRITRATSRA